MKYVFNETMNEHYDDFQNTQPTLSSSQEIGLDNSTYNRIGKFQKMGKRIINFSAQLAL